MLVGEDFTYGRTLKYICDLGSWMDQGVFEMDITCLENGNWDTLPTDCTGNLVLLVFTINPIYIYPIFT